MRPDDFGRYLHELPPDAELATVFAGGGTSVPDAMHLAEEHRAFLTWFCYDCGYALHTGIGERYTADERYTRSIDALRPGPVPAGRDFRQRRPARMTDSEVAGPDLARPEAPPATAIAGRFGVVAESGAPGAPGGLT